MPRIGRLVLATLLAAAPLAAQESPLVQRLPASARALGMGDVFAPGRGDAAVVFYHPAFLREGSGIAGGAQWLGRDTVALEAAGAMEWLGGVGVAVRSVRYTDGCRCAYPGIYTSPPPVAVSEQSAQLTYGRTLMGVRLALTGRYLEQRWNLDRGAAWGADLSAGLAPGPLRVALTARNLGPDLQVGGVDVPVARTVALAAAPVGGPELGPLDVLPAVELAWERGARFSPGAGIEIGYWPVVGRTFFLRAGARRVQTGEHRRPFTAGAGFAGDKIGIDYALEPLDGGRFSHRVGLRWR